VVLVAGLVTGRRRLAGLLLAVAVGVTAVGVAAVGVAAVGVAAAGVAVAGVTATGVAVVGVGEVGVTAVGVAVAGVTATGVGEVGVAVLGAAALAAIAFGGVIAALERVALLARSPRPWLSIQPPVTARPMSISNTTMIRPHGRRAIIGIESDGSSSCDERGRDDLTPLAGALDPSGALAYSAGGELVIARGGGCGLGGTNAGAAGTPLAGYGAGGAGRPAPGSVATWAP
jgi:hypothetical protein